MARIEERAWQRARGAVDGDLALGHRLEQGALGLRHRAVDLVDEQDVGEHRARLELELPLTLVVDRQARDVGRLEVGRALDPRRGRAVDRAGDRPGEHRLRGPGHVLEQDVPVAEQRAHDEPDLVALPADDELDVVEQPVAHRSEAGCRLRGLGRDTRIRAGGACGPGGRALLARGHRQHRVGHPGEDRRARVGERQVERLGDPAQAARASPSHGTSAA